MVEKLADIVQKCFPEKYEPVEALVGLFSHTYIPEQDHEDNFLLALKEKYDQHEKRTFGFLDALQEGRETNDALFEKVLERAFDKLGYANFSDMVKKYEEYKEKRLIRNVEEWRKDLFSQFTGVSPNSLIALWAIQHEAELSTSEKDYLVECIHNWPNMDKMDPRRSAIYTKYSAIAQEKLWQFGARVERRTAAYEQSTRKELFGLALHDFDHQLTTHWDVHLNPKYE